MKKCETCLHEDNWKTLNQMPDLLRKTQQAPMRRIDESWCHISNGQLFTPKVIC